MTRPVPEEALALIRGFESCRLAPYHDSAGFVTIGWGHLLSHKAWAPLKQWEPITQEDADRLFEEDVDRMAQAVERLVTVPLTDGQYGALVSFCFNLGPDEDDDTVPEGLGDSTLLRKLNSGDYEGAHREFAKWNKAGGVVLNGLVRRRAAEAALFAGDA